MRKKTCSLKRIHKITHKIGPKPQKLKSQSKFKWILSWRKYSSRFPKIYFNYESQLWYTISGTVKKQIENLSNEWICRGKLWECLGHIWNELFSFMFFSFWLLIVGQYVTRQISTRQTIWYKKEHLYSMTINLASPPSSCQDFMLSNMGLSYWLWQSNSQGRETLLLEISQLKSGR